jgi:hypothetical protein
VRLADEARAGQTHPLQRNRGALGADQRVIVSEQPGAPPQHRHLNEAWPAKLVEQRKAPQTLDPDPRLGEVGKYVPYRFLHRHVRAKGGDLHIRLARQGCGNRQGVRDVVNPANVQECNAAAFGHGFSRLRRPAAEGQPVPGYQRQRDLLGQGHQPARVASYETRQSTQLGRFLAEPSQRGLHHDEVKDFAQGSFIVDLRRLIGGEDAIEPGLRPIDQCIADLLSNDPPRMTWLRSSFWLGNRPRRANLRALITICRSMIRSTLLRMVWPRWIRRAIRNCGTFSQGSGR